MTRIRGRTVPQMTRIEAGAAQYPAVPSDGRAISAVPSVRDKVPWAGYVRIVQVWPPGGRQGGWVGGGGGSHQALLLEPLGNVT